MRSAMKDRTPISPERFIVLNPGVPSRVPLRASLKCLTLSVFRGRGQVRPRSANMTRGPKGPADRQAPTAVPRRGLSRFASGSPQNSPQGSKRWLLLTPQRIMARRLMASRPVLTWPRGQPVLRNMVKLPYRIWLQDHIIFEPSRWRRTLPWSLLRSRVAMNRKLSRVPIRECPTCRLFVRRSQTDVTRG